jgi:hypothetical protein|tara:strand:- start:255 stop:851 length:597 start_codon:yes stop_codon:yes gene_type:complete
MALTATTELEAVNGMLAAISEAPVSNLDTDTIDDALIAHAVLLDVSKEIQNQGWHFNKDYDWPISVNGDLKLPYPATAAHVDPVDPTVDLVKRGAFFWDRKERSFTYTAGSSYKFIVVWLLDYEDLPQSFRTWIAMRAANRFVQQQLGDQGAVAYSREEMGMAMANAKADDLRRSDSNILRSSNSARRVHGRRTAWRG